MGNKEKECCASVQIERDHGEKTCPRCKGEGVPVSKVTVQHLVKDTYNNTIGDGQFKVCMNPVCEVVYFGLDEEIRFTQDQVKVPIWFKDGSKPKYACYCSEITEEQVIDAVRTLGADSLKDVIALTGAMHNSACIEKNPLGVCCHMIIEEAMLKAKGM